MEANKLASKDAWILEIIGTIYFGIFGYFFYTYSTDKARYDDCKHPQFLDWSTMTTYMCFAIIGMYVLRLVLRICDWTQSLAQLWMGLDYTASIAILIACIGLAVKNDDSCGDLSTLAMVFYIITFVCVGLSLLSLCCCCCVGGGMLAAGLVAANAADLEKQPINRQDHDSNTTVQQQQYTVIENNGSQEL